MPTWTGTLPYRADAAPGGGIFQAFDSININDAGIVAFGAALLNAPTSSFGIFTAGPGGVQKIIRIGEALFGSTVTSLHPTTLSLGLNDQSQIAFRYSLTDGRQGIAIARFGSVAAAAAPEPGTLLLLGTGALAGALMILRRRMRA